MSCSVAVSIERGHTRYHCFHLHCEQHRNKIIATIRMYASVLSRTCKALEFRRGSFIDDCGTYSRSPTMYLACFCGEDRTLMSITVSPAQSAVHIVSGIQHALRTLTCYHPHHYRHYQPPQNLLLWGCTLQQPLQLSCLWLQGLVCPVARQQVAMAR